MSDEKNWTAEVFKHAYAQGEDGCGTVIPLVSGVPVGLYRAALEEIRSLSHRIDELSEGQDEPDAREVILTLMSFGYDKASNSAWAESLCRAYGLDLAEVRRESWRRSVKKGTR